MTKDFRTRSIGIDFPIQPFDSAMGVLLRSLRIFFANFAFLATVTFVVFLPGKLLLQFIGYLLDIAPEGILSYVLMDLSDLVLGSLVAGAVIYGLIARFRSKPAPIGECLRWGRRQWGRMLWNTFKVEITVSLWSLLLFVPGLIAMVKLAVTEAVVAIEGDRESAPLARSTELTAGHRWRIFATMLPLLVLDFGASWLVLNAAHGLSSSRLALAAIDSLLSVGGQLTRVTMLMIYLGLVND